MDPHFESFAHSKVAVFNAPLENEEVARRIASGKNAKQNNEPFFVVNVTNLISKFQQWQTEMPRVKPYYAVKSNDDPVILKTLASLGCGFDCASKSEIEQILGDAKLTSPENIVYANTCKTPAFVSYAAKMGLNHMTFDSEEELYKVKQYHPNPKMLLRIAVTQSQYGTKFGCDPESVGPKLLQKAAELKIPVIGVAFSIGHGCNVPENFTRVIKHARDIFDIGISLGHAMTLLDMGGGFPGIDTEELSLKRIAKVIDKSLDEHFPISGNYKIIAEPGRFFVCTSVSVSASIIAAVKVPANRITNNESDSNEYGFMYYMNDGVYGSFNCKLFDHYSPAGRPLFPKKDDDEKTSKFLCTIWGPTCASLDQVEVCTKMREMKVGEWLHYPNMGAYTSVTASTFNGFQKPKFYYYIDEQSLKIINKNS